MPNSTNINVQRVIKFIEEIRKRMKPMELFTIIAPVTLRTLKSIEPNNDDFAHKLGDYIEALQCEITNPMIDMLKENLDALEKSCLESPDNISVAYAVLKETLPSTSLFYDKMIRGRIHMLKRAETEGKRKPLPAPKLIPIPEKDQSEHQEESNVKNLKAKRARAEIERLKKAINRFGFYSKMMEGNYSIASRDNELSRLIPELPYLAQEAVEAREVITNGAERFCILAELALKEMESQTIEKKNDIVAPDPKNTESDKQD